MAGLIGDWWRAKKHRARVRDAEAEIMARPIGQGAQHGLPAPLVVSLTSFPKRYATLHLTLRSLLSQSIAPDRVVLWLAKDDVTDLPSEVRALPGLELAAAEDFRSYKKIIPQLIETPEAFIATADDDVYYSRDWLEGLVAHADAGVVARRAHLIKMQDGDPLRYDDWDRNIGEPERGKLIFPTGVGGVLYAPGVFDPEVTNIALARELAPFADDVWLYWMHRRAGSVPEKIGGRFRIVEWPDSQVENLRSINLGQDGNDTAIAAMIRHFGFPS